MSFTDEHVTWIVPCRRAVVKRAATYHDLLDTWRACLMHFRRPMTAWYDLQTGFDQGISQLGVCIAQMDPEASSAPLSRSVSEGSGGTSTGGNSVDVRNMYVRLWKGPLRVLLEEQGRDSSAPASEGDADPIVTEITYRRRTLRLELNRAHREVVNNAAEFLMGDIVEFPLAKFLTACQKTGYQNISFNPSGSFFTGTALLENENDEFRSCEAEPRIHDNLIAMRFQLLVSMFRGAFYNLEDVFRRRTDRAAIASDPDDDRTRVYARGIVYGANWANPTSGLDDGYWSARTNEWGYLGRYDLPSNIPTRSGLDLLGGAGDPPLTPGTACSPTTLTLSSYMLNLDRWGHDSIDTELSPHGAIHQNVHEDRDWVPSQDSAYWGKFEETAVPEDDLLGIGEGSECRQARENLTQRMNQIRQDLGDPAPLQWPFIDDSHLEGLHRSVRQQAASARREGTPASVLSTVNQRLRDIRQPDRNPEREAQLEQERAALRAIHAGVYDKFREIRTVLQELMNDEQAWQRAGLTPLEVDLPDWPAEDHPVVDNCRESHGITSGSIRTVLRALQNKVEAAENTSSRDVLSSLCDINVFSLSSHELSIVKVYPFEKLMDRETLPFSGRMASYDPLSGIEDFPAESIAEAQLFFLEASGALEWYIRSNGQRVQACGIQPFNYAMIDNNFMSFRLDGRTMKFWPGPPHGDGRTVRNAWRIQDNVLRAVYPGSEQGMDASPAHPEFKPFVIMGLRGAASVPLGDREAIYAERALPFPTFRFANDNGNYPRVSQIRPYLNTAHTEVTSLLPSQTDDRSRRAFTEFQGAV
jgi:hypothetical protein